MRNKKFLLVFAVIVAAGSFWFFKSRLGNHESEGILSKEIHPVRGTIENSFSTTGTVLPLNRLEVKPPVGGRIDKILVQEGQKVQAGGILAWMSSTERAALMDAAVGKGQDQVAYWQDVYKPIPLLSPIDANVIVAKLQPGQTVTVSDPVIVLSDKLIVRAQVDETDIGKVKVGQEAVIDLDAYPDTKMPAEVSHVYYESKIVNNVTIYEVDLLPESIPDFVRSGMNATIHFIQNRKDDVLVLPLEAVITEGPQNFVLVKTKGTPDLIQRNIQTGLSDDKNIEILSGVNPEDTVIIKARKYILPSSKSGSNPLVPTRRRPGQR